MNKEIYADNISAIHVTGNIVRIDFVSLQPQMKADNGQPVFDINNRVVMPLEGFVNAYSVMENIIKQLIANGVLQPAAPAEEPAILE